MHFFVINCVKIKGKEVLLVSCVFDSAEINVRETDRVLNDGQNVYQDWQNWFLSKEVKYHNECKRSYMKSGKNISSEQDNSEHLQVSQCVLSFFFSYIEASVIDTIRPEYLTSVHRRYYEIINKTAKEKIFDS